ncbi:YjdJ family protein [Psychrobacillus sp. FSL H8-0483]|uniref:YjdJ family protein n=1 Tax=Psychrobacillus sp. FSL H8-0483 TaxID=2921389 RepID=UPI00315B2CB9
MFKYIIQLIIGTLILCTATFIAWYEGSAIMNHPWEWKYSTPFTKLFNMDIMDGHDISQLDYFVYAAKFQPLFPAIMMVSGIYILCVIGYYLLKCNYDWTIGYFGLIGCILLVVSGLIYNSPTNGGRIFFWITSVCGFIFMAVAGTGWIRNAQHKETINT